MHAPTAEPIGLLTTRTAKVLSRAFDDALAEAGGSLPTWLVLMSLRGRRARRPARARRGGGRRGAHPHPPPQPHGVPRPGDPPPRPGQPTGPPRELTEAGEAAFDGLLHTVIAFDARLRAGFTDDELATLRDFLGRLRTNVATPAPEVVA